MSELFILQNQDKLFFSKHKEWVDGRDLNSLFKSAYKDEAINEMVEISAKDYRQRIKVIRCVANEKGLPTIDPDILPDPLPKAGKDLFAELEVTAATEQADTAAVEDGDDENIDIQLADMPPLSDILTNTESANEAIEDKSA